MPEVQLRIVKSWIKNFTRGLVVKDKTYRAVQHKGFTTGY